MKFLSIYIREAHPVDGWWLGGGLTGLAIKRYAEKVAVDVYEPKTIEERRAIAGQCETALLYGIRTYVDDMQDTVNRALAAHPTRLYLVGVDGRVVYAGGIGPWGYKPDELEKAIQSILVT